jgi:Mg2+/Co2+ transporter CorC
LDTLKKRYRKSDSIISRKIDDEFILVPIRQDVGELSSIYTLNEVAARIWELIDGKCTVEDIREKIVEEYEVEFQAAEEDIRYYLKQMESNRFILSD